ncbi:MAG: endonuclease/exonuclease/phosphatase family protein, partial [Bacteroidota bacterium]
IANDYLPEGWLWAYDTTTPTNRKLADAYVKGETFTTLIDFYLVSPNVKIERVRTINQDFQYSDHQPVILYARLN